MHALADAVQLRRGCLQDECVAQPHRGRRELRVKPERVARREDDLQRHAAGQTLDDAGALGRIAALGPHHDEVVGERRTIGVAKRSDIE